MHPISRKVSGDRTLAGRTTHHGMPTSQTVGKTGAFNKDRINYFRFHARSAPNMRDSMGHFGSGEEGSAHLGARRSARGGTVGDDEYSQDALTGSTIVDSGSTGSTIREESIHTPSFGSPHTRPELHHVGRTVAYLHKPSLFHQVTQNPHNVPGTRQNPLPRNFIPDGPVARSKKK